MSYLSLPQAFSAMKSENPETAVARMAARLKRQTRKATRANTEIQIPFPGFYNSHLSGIVESWQEREADHYCDNAGEIEGLFPLPEGLEPQEGPHDLIWQHFNHNQAYQAIAKDYAESFWQAICEEFGIVAPDNAMRFSGMESPREYNFTTDRVFIKVTPGALRKLRKVAESDSATFEAIIAERHGSRDGFRSFYSTDSEYWQKETADYDHNELQTVLIAALEIKTGDSEGWIREFDVSEFYAIAESDYNYCDNALDHDSFISAWNESRLEALSNHVDELLTNSDFENIASIWEFLTDEMKETVKGLLTDTPEELKTLLAEIESRYRCEKTPDLFA